MSTSLDAGHSIDATTERFGKLTIAPPPTNAPASARSDSKSADPPSPLLDLPSELAQHLLLHCDLPSLLSLSRTSRTLNGQIELTLRHHALHLLAYAPSTVAHTHRGWSWKNKARWSYDVEENWDRWACGGEVLGGSMRRWERKCMPVMILWPRVDGRGRVVIGRGTVVEVWEVDGYQRSWEMLGARDGGTDEITAVVAVEGAEDDLIISYASGVVKRVTYVAAVWQGRQRIAPASLREKSRYGSTGVPSALQSSGDLLLSASTLRPRPAPVTSKTTFLETHRSENHTHTISLQSIASPWLDPSSTFTLPTKPCSLLLPPSSPTWFAVGHSGETPLSIYTLTPSGPLATPQHLTGNTGKTSVYSLTSPHPLSAHFRSDTTVMAAFYDSSVRIYDLRSSSPAPVMECTDPWSDDPAYSIASGGPTGSYVVSGTARNGALRIWDVRSTATPMRGVTMFAPPGRARTPVYCVQVETSRIWGAMEQSAFVVDFEGTRREGRGDVAYTVHSRVDAKLRTTASHW